MNPSSQLFIDAVKLYPDFKDLFARFCAEMAKRLNGNTHLPDVNFSVAKDGASATLQALDRTFDISFRFVIIDSTPWGLLRVAHPGEDKKPVQLFHLFFDNLGNVKTAPDASAALHSLSSSEFVKTFINRVTLEYFFRLWSSLK